MRMLREQSLLLVVDLQTRLLPAIDEGAAVLGHGTWLVDLAQAVGVPVLATEHCAEAIGPLESTLRERFPAGTLVGKRHFSGVNEGALLAAPEAGRRQWVVCGSEAHVCVLQTVLDLLTAGRQVFVVDEAVGSRRAADKALALARMRQAGAVIVSREMVAFARVRQLNA